MWNSYSGAVLLISLGLLFGCGSVSGPSGSNSSGNGSGGSSTPSGSSGTDGPTVSVGETTIGTLSASITGLSYPKAAIMKTYCPLCAASTGIPAKRMIALMTTAGIRHLRIVTDEVGTVISYVPDSPPMNQAQNEIGNLDFQNFANFICSVPNLTFSWGINYLGNTPANAAAEAAAIDQLLGPDGTACPGRLTGFEIGNEPDSPGYGPVDATSSVGAFVRGWRQFASQIKAAVPGAVMVGPSLGGASDFAIYMPSFIAANADLLGVITQHYYQIGTVAQATVAGILPDAPDPTISQKIAPDLASVSAANHSLPVEINETNTVANGGAVGISNTFASAIYAVTNAFDFSTYAWGAGELTLDYSSEGTPLYGPTYTGGYSPIIDGPSYTGPNPMLSGIKLLNMIGPGDIKQCTLSAGDINLRCFVVVNGNTTKVVLVNQEGSVSEPVTAVFPESIQSASSIVMTAPSLTATTEITIQGGSIQSDGSLDVGEATPLEVIDNTQVSTTVPAHSVLVLTAN